MRGQPIEVVLANGNVVSIPRVSPFGAPEGIAEKLRFLEDQTRGVTIERLKRKIMREIARAERLEKMSERCDAFIQHPDTPTEKREEYLKKIESYDSQIDGAYEAIEKSGDEIANINDQIDQFANEVAIWILTEKAKLEDAGSLIDPDISVDVCRAALGLAPSPKGADDEGPLAPTPENSSGAVG